jgi:hypothetical protein
MSSWDFIAGCFFLVIGVRILIDWISFAFRGKEDGFQSVQVNNSDPIQYATGVIVRFLCYPLFVLFGSIILFMYLPFFGLTTPNVDVVRVALTVVVPISVGGAAWAMGWGRYVD